MIISFREDEQLFLDSKARLNIFDYISKGKVDSNIKIAKSQEICIFGDSYFTIIDSLDNFKHFFFFSFTILLLDHILNQKAIHLIGSQVVIETH